MKIVVDICICAYQKKTSWNRSVKEMSLSHKFKHSNSYFFTTWLCKPLIFQTMFYVKSKSLSLQGLENLSLSQKLISFEKKINIDFFLYLTLSKC